MSDLSRVEQLLENSLNVADHEVVPQSRVEDLLQRLDEALEWNEQEGGVSRSNVGTIISGSTIAFKTRINGEVPDGT